MGSVGSGAPTISQWKLGETRAQDLPGRVQLDHALVAREPAEEAEHGRIRRDAAAGRQRARRLHRAGRAREAGEIEAVGAAGAEHAGPGCAHHARVHDRSGQARAHADHALGQRAGQSGDGRDHVLAQAAQGLAAQAVHGVDATRHADEPRAQQHQQPGLGRARVDDVWPHAHQRAHDGCQRQEIARGRHVARHLDLDQQRALGRSQRARHRARRAEQAHVEAGRARRRDLAAQEHGAARIGHGQEQAQARPGRLVRLDRGLIAGAGIAGIAVREVRAGHGWCGAGWIAPGRQCIFSARLEEPCSVSRAESRP